MNRVDVGVCLQVWCILPSLVKETLTSRKGTLAGEFKLVNLIVE